MTIRFKNISNLLIIATLGFALGACSSDDDDHDDVHNATVVPAINPAFDDVTMIESSATADGDFAEFADTNYSFDNETITFKEDVIPAGGLFLKITGPVTMHHGMTAVDRTVFTYVGSNAEAISANELTTLAVARMANGDQTTWANAVKAVADESGLSEVDVTKAMNAARRAELPDLVGVMKEMSSLDLFADTEITIEELKGFAAQTSPNMNKIAWGALLYDNWMKSPESAPVLITEEAGNTVIDHSMHKPSKVSARAGEHDMDSHGGDDINKMPGNLMVAAGPNDKHMLASDGEHHEGFRRFARCSQCHGFDMKGDAGSFLNRGRSSTTLTNADDANDSADFDQRPLAANVDLTSTGATISSATILTGGAASSTGQKYANLDSMIMGADAATAAANWNAAITTDSDKHPDYTRAADIGSKDDGSTGAADDGEYNDIVPTMHQMGAIEAFLNYKGGRYDEVFDSSVANGEFTIKTGAHTLAEMAEDGEMRYAHYCFRCHGSPTNESPNALSGKGGNFKGYLTESGGTELNHMRVSALFHFARWGKAGTVMDRSRIGAPTASDVANIVAFLTSVQDGSYTPTMMSTMGMGDADDGKAFYEDNCVGCHSAHDGSTDNDASPAYYEDTEARCHDHDDDKVVSKVEGVCPTGSEEIPNLASHMHHPKMVYDLEHLSSAMSNTPRLSQENINDLAAFFRKVAAGGSASQ